MTLCPIYQFPSVTTEITEPRSALQWISSIPLASYFLESKLVVLP